MKNKTIIRGLTGALVMGGLCAAIPSVYGQGIGLKRLDDMLTPTEQKVERGKTVYQRQCAMCHGDNGMPNAAQQQQYGLGDGGFTTGQWKYGGGLVQIYNVISKKQELVPANVAAPAVPEEGGEVAPAEQPAVKGYKHNVYAGLLPYQDRWAVAHYVRSLSPTKPADPTEVLETVRFEAENGVCYDDVRLTISTDAAPKGDEQLTKGKEIYAQQCASCHGENGQGNGPAAAALQPHPRNFVAKDNKWTNGSSPLAIYNTLTKGIEGTSMASYASLKPEERWALAHYVREWVPSERLEQSTDDEITEVCRSKSAPPKPEPIAVEDAMKFLVADAPARRVLKQKSYGVVYLEQKSNAEQGKELYMEHCSQCHGAQGEGGQPMGPYGAFQPFLYLKVERLIPASAGGTYSDFAERSSQGVHATLPDMTGAAMLSQGEWMNLQAFVADFEGDGEVTYVQPTDAAVPTPAVAPDGGSEGPEEGAVENE